MELILLEQLEVLREKMIKTGLEQGLQNMETIKISKQLDDLLNEYERLQEPPNDSASDERFGCCDRFYAEGCYDRS